jgi:hypothetical protein
MKGLEDAFALLLGHTRPAIDDADDQLLPRRGDADLHVLGRRRELERVVEDVDEDPLDLKRIDAYGRCLARNAHVHTIAIVDLVQGPGDELVRRPDLGSGRRGTRLEPREVEQVVDEALEPAVLDSDRLEEPGSIALVQLEDTTLEPIEGRFDRRQRCAQIVRDRLDHRSLDRVALPECLGVERLASEPLALGCSSEQRCEPGEQAPLNGEARLLVDRCVQRSDLPLADFERVRRLV